MTTELCGHTVPVMTGCDGRPQPPLVCGLPKGHSGVHLYRSGDYLIDLDKVPVANG